MIAAVYVKPLSTGLVVPRTYLDPMVPVDAALNTPTSASVLLPDAVHVLDNWSVSFVTVVVVCVGVTLARAKPESVTGVTRAVCVAANAVVPVPTSR